jgi:hypothetical protein
MLIRDLFTNSPSIYFVVVLALGGSCLVSEYLKLKIKSSFILFSMLKL